MRRPLVVLVTLVISACGLRTGRRLTGTCQGACDHYLSCKHNDDAVARDRCLRECPEVFSDRESLKAFEALSCKDTVEFVEGSDRRTSSRNR